MGIKIRAQHFACVVCDICGTASTELEAPLAGEFPDEFVDTTASQEAASKELFVLRDLHDIDDVWLCPSCDDAIAVRRQRAREEVKLAPVAADDGCDPTALGG